MKTKLWTATAYSALPLPKRTCRNRCAFSLIEILAALTVVGILAVIISFALEGGRQAAQSTKCLSNVRQIGMLHLAYAADNEGALLNASAAGPNWQWTHQLSNAGYIDLTDIREHPERPSIFHCPSRDIPDPDKWMEQDHMHYGANMYPGFNNNADQIHLHKIHDLQNPGQTFLVGEINSNYAIWASMVRAAYPHNEHINMLFADGSARRLKGPLPPLPSPAPEASSKETFPFY